MTLRSIPKQMAAKITSDTLNRHTWLFGLTYSKFVYCMFGRAYENNLLHGHTLLSAYFYKLDMIVY